MLDLAKYSCIGAALKDAMSRFADEICLIEADSDRASIIMTNQSKWLISAFAIFYSGGILVPLDYKLTPVEQWQLLQHSGAKILVTEYPIWRQLSASPGRATAPNIQAVLVTE